MRYFNPAFVTRPPLFVAWNQIDRSDTITLSNALLTAISGAATDGAVRATFKRATGKYYAELNMQTVTGGDTGGGFADTTAVLANIGGSVSGAVMQFKGGNVYNNGSLQFNNGNMSAGGILRLAYDADNHKAWLAFATGNWNNSGAANPATNAGGLDVSGWDSGGLFPCFCAGGSADQCTANFGATSFTYSAPAGFSSWNAS